MNTYKRKALQNLFPNSSFTELTEGGEIVSSNENLLKVTDAEIDAEIYKIKEEETKTQYKHDRASAYPSYADQLDYIFHHGIEKWKTDIVQPVKDKFPKP